MSIHASVYSSRIHGSVHCGINYRVLCGVSGSELYSVSLQAPALTHGGGVRASPVSRSPAVLQPRPTLRPSFSGPLSARGRLRSPHIRVSSVFGAPQASRMRRASLHTRRSSCQSSQGGTSDGQWESTSVRIQERPYAQALSLTAVSGSGRSLGCYRNNKAIAVRSSPFSVFTQVSVLILQS